MYSQHYRSETGCALLAADLIFRGADRPRHDRCANLQQARIPDRHPCNVQWVKKRLKGREIWIKSIQNKSKQSDTQWSAILFVDGVNINEEMIDEGMASRLPQGS